MRGKMATRPVDNLNASVGEAETIWDSEIKGATLAILAFIGQ
jgi:hypothetical protein